MEPKVRLARLQVRECPHTASTTVEPDVAPSGDARTDPGADSPRTAPPRRSVRSPRVRPVAPALRFGGRGRPKERAGATSLINQSLGTPTEPVEHRKPRTLEELEMDTAELAALAAEGRRKRLALVPTPPSDTSTRIDAATTSRQYSRALPCGGVRVRSPQLSPSAGGTNQISRC
jgi:hypothetical protein